MTERDLIAVPCVLSPGMFASERFFEIRLADGNEYQGISPCHFCWDAHGKLHSEKRPIADDSQGFIAARFVDQLDNGQIAIEVPDAKVVVVMETQRRNRPTRIVPYRDDNAA